MKELRFQFSEPFRSQLERALRGYCPPKQEVFKQKAMKKKPPSEKQIKWLTEYNRPIPETMAEASKILDEIWGK